MKKKILEKAKKLKRRLYSTPGDFTLFELNLKEGEYFEESGLFSELINRVSIEKIGERIACGETNFGKLKLLVSVSKIPIGLIVDFIILKNDKSEGELIDKVLYHKKFFIYLPTNLES